MNSYNLNCSLRLTSSQSNVITYSAVYHIIFICPYMYIILKYNYPLSWLPVLPHLFRLFPVFPQKTFAVILTGLSINRYTEKE